MEMKSLTSGPLHLLSLPVLRPTLVGVSTMKPPTPISYQQDRIQALWQFHPRTADWRRHHNWSLGRK